MPAQRAPLLSLSASGKVGGRRRGAPRRVTELTQLTVLPDKDSYIDALFPNDTYGNLPEIGCYIHFNANPLKDELKRCLLMFDISQIDPTLAIQSATLTLETILSWAVTDARVSRSGRAATWSGGAVSWNDYTPGSAWTPAGGEIDHVTPPAVPFTTPSGPGPFVLPDISAHAQDAIDNRAGLMSIILNLVNETDQPDRGPVFFSKDQFPHPSPTLVIIAGP